MKNYILSIVAASIISGIASQLLSEKTTAGQIARLLCGILMAVTVLAPFKDISFQNVTDYFYDRTMEAQMYVQDGKSAAQQNVKDIIISKTEAYILDKGNRMGLQIAVEVELDEKNNSVPCGVTVTGKISPYEKEVLGVYIEDTLGITKENQRWM